MRAVPKAAGEAAMSLVLGDDEGLGVVQGLGFRV